MANPFAVALGPLFGGPRAVAATFLPVDGDPVTGIRVIKTETPVDLQLGSALIRAGSILIEIKLADVADPEDGRVQIGTDVFEILGEPRLDDEGVAWTCEAAIAIV